MDASQIVDVVECRAGSGKALVTEMKEAIQSHKTCEVEFLPTSKGILCVFIAKHKTGRPKLAESNPHLVKAIRKMRMEGKTYDDISFELGVSRTTISNIAKKEAV